MKRILSLCMALLLFTSVWASAEDTETEAPAAPPETLTLESAIAYAAENHPQVLSARAALEKCNVAVEEADSLYHQYQSVTSYSYDIFTVKKGLYLTQAQTGQVIAEKTLEQVTESVKLGVKSAFYSYLSAQERAALLTDSLNATLERVAQNQTRYDNGLITKMDLQSSQLSAKKAQTDLEAAQRNVDIALMQLKNAVGIPVHNNLTVTGTLQTPDMPETSVDDAETLALQNSMDILRAQQQLVADEKNFEVVKLWYTPRTYKYMEAKAGAESSAHAYDAAMETARINVHKAYDTMKGAYDTYALAQETRDLKKQAYEISKTQYELGLATPLDVEDAWSAAQSAELDCFDAQYAVIMGAEQYVFSYTVGSVMG